MGGYTPPATKRRQYIKSPSHSLRSGVGRAEACDAPRCTADTDTVRTCIRRITTRNQYKNTPVCVCARRPCVRGPRARVCARARVCVTRGVCVRGGGPFHWKCAFFARKKCARRDE